MPLKCETKNNLLNCIYFSLNGVVCYWVKRGTHLSVFTQVLRTIVEASSTLLKKISRHLLFCIFITFILLAGCRYFANKSRQFKKDKIKKKKVFVGKSLSSICLFGLRMGMRYYYQVSHVSYGIFLQML